LPISTFPDVQRARLSNGIQIIYARRNAVPVTRVAVEFDAGIAADPPNRLGTQALMLDLLDEGTTSLNSVQLAEGAGAARRDDLLGASLDRTAVSLTALTPALGPVARSARRRHSAIPPLRPSEVERLRQQQLAGIAQEMTQPGAIASRAMPGLLYGTNHPYGKPFTGSGDPAVVSALTRDELIAFHQTWIRPDNATIFAVSDLPARSAGHAARRPLRQLAGAVGAARDQGSSRPRSRRRGRASSSSIGRNRRRASSSPARSCPPKAPRDLLEPDRRQRGARRQLPRPDQHGAARAARLVLRRARQRQPVRASGALLIQAPVQSDRTGDSIARGDREVRGFLTPMAFSRPRLNRISSATYRQLPGQFETSGRCSGRCARTRSTGGRTIIGRRSRTAIAA
jgi:hypothetical protein